MKHLSPAPVRDTTLKSSSNKLLVFLLSVDILLLILAIFHNTPKPPAYLIDAMFDLQTEGGYGEIFQHIKELAIVILLFSFAVKKRDLTYFCWAFIFLYLGLDDSFQIHERLGERIANYFLLQTMFHLRPVDFGELTVTALVGLPLAFLAGLSLVKSSGTQRRTFLVLVLLVALLFFFGVALDMAAIIAKDFSDLAEISLNLLEDSGEMVTVSIILWYLFRKATFTLLD